ncbi:MAG TPA: TetR/AcrR family transcriptional regulator [Polyangia bacterium]|nr:TetR/AcrR family transcriptional regulator [Polyangia bacterium]
MARARKKSSFHHGDLRRALLDTVVEIMAREGPQAITLREVAARTGVTHAAPYRHFSSKEKLLAAVAEEGFRLMRAQMLEAMVRRGSDPLERWEELGVSYVLFAVRQPCHFRLMYTAELADRSEHAALRDAAAAAYRLLLDVVIESQERGRVRGGDPKQLAATAWAMMHGLAVLLIDRQLGGGKVALDEAEAAARFASQTLRNGLQPAEARPSRRR